MLRTVNDRQLIQLTLQEEFLHKQNVIISWNWVNVLKVNASLNQLKKKSSHDDSIPQKDICRITFLSLYYLLRISVTTNINVLKSSRTHLILLNWVVFYYTSKLTEDNHIVLHQEDTAKPAYMLVCASIIAIMHEWLWNYLIALFPQP